MSKTPETKLALRLRQLADKPEHTDIAQSLLVCAQNLDRTVLSLGIRGARVRELAAYQTAKAWYFRATGAAYRG